jgi:hypothetical protein
MKDKLPSVLLEKLKKVSLTNQNRFIQLQMSPSYSWGS